MIVLSSINGKIGIPRAMMFCSQAEAPWKPEPVMLSGIRPITRWGWEVCQICLEKFGLMPPSWMDGPYAPAQSDRCKDMLMRLHLPDM